MLIFHGCNFSRNQRNQTQPSPKSAPEKRLQGLSLWVKHGPLSKLTALDTQYHTLDFVDEFHLTLSLYTTIPFFQTPGESIWKVVHVQTKL